VVGEVASTHGRGACHRRRLVFTGESDGWFRAYDAKTGKVLWSFFTGTGVNARPASYSVDGRQYIVVRGNDIIAFTF